MQWIAAVLLLIAFVGAVAYWACFICCMLKASIEEIKQPGGPSRSAVALWVFYGTCFLCWLLRAAG